MIFEVQALSYDEVVNLLSTALYGSPWFMVDNTTTEYKESIGDTIEDKLAHILFIDKEVIIVDIEENESYKLTFKDLLNGLSLYISHGGSADIDEYDWCNADCVLQYALFGEVIYG